MNNVEDNKPKTKMIKQPKGSRLCLACCAAMATNTTLLSVMHTLIPYPQGGIPMREFVRYLAIHGFMCGSVFQSEKSIQISKTSKMTIPVDMDYPALIIVESDDPGKYHSIYWDGSEVFDPAPEKNETFLEDYKIMDIYQIAQFNEPLAVPDIFKN